MHFRPQMKSRKLIKNLFLLFHLILWHPGTLPCSFIHPIYPYDSVFFFKVKMHILINEIVCEAIVLTFLHFELINFTKLPLISAL